MGFFPPPAEAILSAMVGTLDEAGGGDHPPLTDRESPAADWRLECSQVTLEEVRAQDAILTGVRAEDSEGYEVEWEITPILPHGARFYWGGSALVRPF